VLELYVELVDDAVGADCAGEQGDTEGGGVLEVGCVEFLEGGGAGCAG